MIANIDPLKSAVTSVVSAFAGTTLGYINLVFANISLSSANTAFQHLAWTTAILAGMVSVINGVRQWRKPKSKEK
jgi:uncharacterized membrane protein YjfL (UPF0719 family)